jgi:hypothetical protein
MPKKKQDDEPISTKKPLSQTPDKSEENLITFPIDYFCSFCGRKGNYLNPLIAGPRSVFICVDCVEICIAILLSDEQDNSGTNWRQRVNDVLTNPNKFKIEIGKKKRKRENSKKTTQQ